MAFTQTSKEPPTLLGRSEEEGTTLEAAKVPTEEVRTIEAAEVATQETAEMVTKETAEMAVMATEGITSTKTTEEGEAATSNSLMRSRITSISNRTSLPTTNRL